MVTFWACVVDLHGLAGAVPVSEGRRSNPEPPSIVDCELGVSVAARMSRPVFLPEQLKRHALALQLARDIGPIRLRAIDRCRARGGKQGCFQSLIPTEFRG